MFCEKPLEPFPPLILSLLGHSRSSSQIMALSHSAHITSSKGEWPQILGSNSKSTLLKILMAEVNQWECLLPGSH